MVVARAEGQDIIGDPDSTYMFAFPSCYSHNFCPSRNTFRYGTDISFAGFSWSGCSILCLRSVYMTDDPCSGFIP